MQNLYAGNPSPKTEATSRSDDLITRPSEIMQHASFKAGKRIISTISLSDNFVSCTIEDKKDI